VFVKTTKPEAAAAVRIGAELGHRGEPSWQGCCGRVSPGWNRGCRQLAVDICADAFTDGVWFDFVCGDEVYGNSTELREFCEDRGQSQVCLYEAIARHAVLVMAALAACAVTAALLRDRTDTQALPPTWPDQRPPPDPGMIPLTVPQIKNLLATPPASPRPPGHTQHWVNWCRRHQARSRWYHQRTRLARDAGIALVSQQMRAGRG
jgi:hypothetical protein